MNRKSVLVTGGAKRLGAAMCRHFGEAGWHVVIHCNTSREEAEFLARELPSADVVQCDLTDMKTGALMVEHLALRLGDWRCLINSASIFKSDSVAGLHPATNAKSMAVNAAAPALLAQTYMAKARSKTGRRVIQFTDQKLANLNPDFFSYTMSKSAAATAAEMLAMRYSDDDRVYTLAPGAILASHDQTDEEAERAQRMNLLNRRTSAREIADAALYLAEGPLASGQSIHVDSGQHLLDQPRDVIFLEREMQG